MNDLDGIDLSGPDDRGRRGREVRQRLPSADLAVWAPAADRPDPVQLLLGEETNRVAELLALRHERMSASAFAVYRGAAVIFATDAGRSPTPACTPSCAATPISPTSAGTRRPSAS